MKSIPVYRGSFLFISFDSRATDAVSFKTAGNVGVLIVVLSKASVD